MPKPSGVLLLCSLFALPLQAVAAPPRGIVPVVGSTPGAFGAHFKTELQLNNRSAQTMKGRLVFHPQGVAASTSDPSISYELAPHVTLQFDDIVEALHATGLGSLDLIPEGKGMPTVVARAFNDAGAAGTSGATVPLVREGEAAAVGQVITLIAPSDRSRLRFNIGIRALSSGAALHATVYNSSGVVVKEVDLDALGIDTFRQITAESLLQTTLAGDESIQLRVTAGSALVYSTTTDNITNDPSLSLAAKNDSP